jgi:16S rRNA (adenine1518-N6/adenine1519-N6)-dimethyltransferase
MQTPLAAMAHNPYPQRRPSNTPKKRFGQNFLFDPSILMSIIEVAQLLPSDTVIEIGPGHGRLTMMIAERVKKVIAIEIDRELFENLSKDLSYHDDLSRGAGQETTNIELVHGDALRYPYERIGPFKVVANIPYYITTPLIFRLIEVKKNLQSMTLTVQKEVAERIVAQPCSKEYGVLSIAIQYHGKPSLAFTIPKGAFRPVPEVDSAVIHIAFEEQGTLSVRDKRLFFRVVRAAFSKRRKTIANSLKALFPDAKAVLNSLGIDILRRPQTFTMEEFGKIADVFSEQKGLNLPEVQPSDHNL